MVYVGCNTYTVIVVSDLGKGWSAADANGSLRQHPTNHFNAKNNYNCNIKFVVGHDIINSILLLSNYIMMVSDNHH